MWEGLHLHMMVVLIVVGIVYDIFFVVLDEGTLEGQKKIDVECFGQKTIHRGRFTGSEP